MKEDLSKTLYDEIADLIEKLIENGWKQEDISYVNKTTPFLVNPGSKNKEWEKKIGLVIYPKLLTYGNIGGGKGEVVVPWLCCRIELENEDEDLQYKLCKWLVKELTDIGYKPFHDEDSFSGYFSREKHEGWVKLSCYVNPSYPDGYWENHTL